MFHSLIESQDFKYENSIWTTLFISTSGSFRLETRTLLMLALAVSFTIFLEFAQTFATVTGHLHVDGNGGLRRNIHVEKNQVSYGHFAVERFHRLQGSVGLSIDVSNYRECALSCVNNPPCTSFNVASSPRPEGKFRCELLNEDEYSASPGQLTRSQEYHHYSIKVFRRLPERQL